MTSNLSPVLVAARLVVLALGAAITWVSFRAYRREGHWFLRDAAVGFGVITVGVFVEGALYQVAALDLTTVHVVESAAIALGFAVLLWSLRR